MIFKIKETTGIEEIDKMYNKINVIFTGLVDSLLTGKPIIDSSTTESVTKLIHSIKGYCLYEEVVMMIYGFPEINKHVDVHEKLLKKLTEIKSKFILKSDKTNNINHKEICDLCYLLKLFWKNHVENEDKKMIAFVLNKLKLNPEGKSHVTPSLSNTEIRYSS